MKLPAFQFYPGDWRKDPGVQSLTFHDRGVWLEILCLMSESEQRGKLLLNGAKMPEDALGRLLGLDNQILTTTLTTLLTHGVASIDPATGAIINRRMVRDENIRQTRKECGKLGGNPNLVNQKPTTKVKQIPTTRDNQKSTPSSSSSSSSSISIRGIPTLEEVKLQAAKIMLPEIEAEKFFNYYSDRDWMRGKNKLKRWTGALANWKINWQGYGGTKPPPQSNGGRPDWAC